VDGHEGGLVKKVLLVVATVVAAAWLASGAAAAQKQLWSDLKVDAIASDIAGVSVRVEGEDDWNEWASSVGPDDPFSVAGFTFPFAGPSSIFYHRLFVSPDYWRALADAANYGPKHSSDLYRTATAIFVLTHEAFHFRLFSLDENRVNACALQAIPSVLTRHFGLSATIAQTTSTPTTRTVRVKYLVQVRGHQVRRYRNKLVTRYAPTTTTIPDPTFTEILADVQDIYRNGQPSEYNTGTCW
jgi:hypothetical protein